MVLSMIVVACLMWGIIVLGQGTVSCSSTLFLIPGVARMLTVMRLLFAVVTALTLAAVPIYPGAIL